MDAAVVDDNINTPAAISSLLMALHQDLADTADVDHNKNMPVLAQPFHHCSWLLAPQIQRMQQMLIIT